MESTKIFEKSKKRTSRPLQQLSENQLQGTISSVVLRAIYEQVTLTLMDVKIDTDIHTFVNVAVIWALSELELFNRDMLSDEQLRRSGLTTGRLPEDFMYCNYTRTFPFRTSILWLRVTRIPLNFVAFLFFDIDELGGFFSSLSTKPLNLVASFSTVPFITFWGIWIFHEISFLFFNPRTHV